MALTVNKVILLGNLGRDPEVKNFENGGSICTFSIATQESYWDREKNQRVDLPTDWHNIHIGIPGLVKLAQSNLKKGSKVYVEGVLRNRQYTTKEGETKYITEVHVENMVLLSGSNAGAQAGGTPQASMQTTPPPAVPAVEDDLPF